MSGQIDLVNQHRLELAYVLNALETGQKDQAKDMLKRMVKELAPQRNYPLGETVWKSDFVRLAWFLLSEGNMPKEAHSEVISLIRRCCDDCGTPSIWDKETRRYITEVEEYQCCWVKNAKEDHVARLCNPCHRKRQEKRPHLVISI